MKKNDLLDAFDKLSPGADSSERMLLKLRQEEAKGLIGASGEDSPIPARRKAGMRDKPILAWATGVVLLLVAGVFFARGFSRWFFFNSESALTVRNENSVDMVSGIQSDSEATEMNLSRESIVLGLSKKEDQIPDAAPAVPQEAGDAYDSSLVSPLLEIKAVQFLRTEDEEMLLRKDEVVSFEELEVFRLLLEEMDCSGDVLEESVAPVDYEIHVEWVDGTSALLLYSKSAGVLDGYSVSEELRDWLDVRCR